MSSLLKLLHSLANAGRMLTAFGSLSLSALSVVGSILLALTDEWCSLSKGVKSTCGLFNVNLTCGLQDP
jgi:hypothetical protein